MYCFDSHFLNTLGKLAFKFLTFVAIDGVGRVISFFVFTNGFLSSSPSTAFFLSVNLSGSGMY